MWVQRRPRIQAYHSRRLQALREQLDTLQPRVLARSIRAALDDDGLVMLQARQPHTILARIANTGPVTRPKCKNRPEKSSRVKSCMTTLELFGRPATIPFSSCVSPALVDVARTPGTRRCRRGCGARRRFARVPSPLVTA